MNSKQSFKIQKRWIKKMRNKTQIKIPTLIIFLSLKMRIRNSQSLQWMLIIKILTNRLWLIHQSIEWIDKNDQDMKELPEITLMSLLKTSQV